MKLRRLAALLGALALTFGTTSAVLATKSGDTGHKVTICHATSSEKNPYVRPTVDIASAGYNGDEGGHAGHGRDGVWYPGAKADGFDWGDIIPPYTYNDFHYPGLNWTDAGEAIWNNGCTVPEEPEHNPAIHIVKTPSDTQLPAGGGSVTYTYIVTNTGDVSLTNVTVDDNKCSPVTFASGDSNSDDILDVTETWTFECTTNLTETTTNTAVATGYDDETKVTDDDDATVTVSPPTEQNNPAINIVKTASPATLSPGGGPVNYTFVVTNAGDVALTNVTVSDNKCAPVTFVSGDTNDDDKLDLTESWTFTCTATITEDTTNIGTATGHDGDTTVTDTDDATVTIVQVNPQGNTPDIHLEKTAAPLTLPAEGGTVTYTYVVSNTGNEPLTNVSVKDDNGTPGNIADDFDVDCPKTTLAIEESMTCTADVTGTTKTTTNIATASGTAGETTVTDTDDATVTVGSEGAVQGETNVPTAPQTDIGATGDAGSSLPILLIVLGIIGLAAVFLTPARARRR